MVFKITLIIVQSFQLLFALISTGISAGFLARVNKFPNNLYNAIPSYLVALSVLTVIAAATLLICRCCTSQLNRGVHIATLTVSIVWTILWLAAIGRLAAAGGLDDATYEVRVRVLEDDTYDYEDVIDQPLVGLSKSDFSIGVILFLLWITTGVLACIGVVKTRGAAASPQVAMQPQAYKGPQGGVAGPASPTPPYSYPRAGGPGAGMHPV